MLGIKFYKNPERIGGGITEINYDNHRLIIDMGAELDFDGAEPNPMIEGVTIGEANCDGVLITHYHGDHMALVKYVLPKVPIYMSKVSKEIGLAVQNKLRKAERSLEDIETIKTLERANPFSYDDFGKDIRIGAFMVRPIRVDHSAFDALAYVITVGGKKVLFTGDFRSHGYAGKALFKTLEHYVGKVDVIITEGTNLNRIKKPLSEWELKKEFEKVCNQNKYVLYLGASTNIDSLLSMAHAAKDTQRAFVVDDFQKEILNIISCNSKSNFYKRAIYEFDRVKGQVRTYRLGNLDSVKRFYEKHSERSVLVYSMWEGYIERNTKLKELKELCGDKFLCLHSSGHAYAEDIKSLVGICSKGKKETIVLPMHLENFADMKALNLSATIHELQQNENFHLT